MISSDGHGRPGQRRRWRRVAAAIAVVCGGMALGAGSASADTQPIEGVWSLEGGQVNVQQTSAGQYTGTVVAATKFAACDHPVGQAIWKIAGSSLSYKGTHIWYDASCNPEPGGESTWTITQTNPSLYTLTFCTAHPGTGAPDPSAAPGHPVGSTQCFDLTRTLSPGDTPSPPGNTTPPTAGGDGAAGSTLTCAPGAWTNDPTGYTYRWYRNGTPIDGATSPTYTLQSGDEGLTVTCAVTAYNLGGAGSTIASGGVHVAVPSVPGCPAATGSLNGITLGKVKLGMTRKQARAAYTSSSTHGSKYRDFFCLTPIGVRVGYASPLLTKTMTRRRRHAYADHVVWASTSNARYAIDGIRAGATISSAHAKLPRLSKKPLHVGKNFWYLARLSKSTAVLKVRHGIVEEIGIADRRLTKTRRQQAMFMRTFY